MLKLIDLNNGAAGEVLYGRIAVNAADDAVLLIDSDVEAAEFVVNVQTQYNCSREAFIEYIKAKVLAQLVELKIITSTAPLDVDWMAYANWWITVDRPQQIAEFKSYRMELAVQTFGHIDMLINAAKKSAMALAKLKKPFGTHSEKHIINSETGEPIYWDGGRTELQKAWSAVDAERAVFKVNGSVSIADSLQHYARGEYEQCAAMWSVNLLTGEINFA